MNCSHTSVECLNEYEFFRKYRCRSCGSVLLCACERSLAETFLPHQAHIAHEYGTGRRISIDGIGRVCAECRGAVEEPHPRAEGHSAGGKIDRFYWREIFKTYCGGIQEEYGGSFPFKSILEFEAKEPDIAERIRQSARKFWQHRHKTAPKYDTKEQTQAEFLDKVPVPVKTLDGEYRQVERKGQKIGCWSNSKGDLVSVEKLVEDWYSSQGLSVWRCERRLISVWVATFFGVPIQDPADPYSQLAMRHSTVGWTPIKRNTPLISFRLPRDFGSSEYYERRGDVLDTWIDGVRIAQNMTALYDMLLPETKLIRDYLWVGDQEAEELGRVALRVIPNDAVAAALAWAIGHFWDRQPGWPDLLVVGKHSYSFSEVKSPYDQLSQSQMNWFSWAVENAHLQCELVRVKRK